jgi:hypothetical protein
MRMDQTRVDRIFVSGRRPEGRIKMEGPERELKV